MLDEAGEKALINSEISTVQSWTKRRKHYCRKRKKQGYTFIFGGSCVL